MVFGHVSLPVSPSQGTWLKPQETLENWACAQVILHGRMRVLSIQRGMGLAAKHSLHDSGHTAVSSFVLVIAGGCRDGTHGLMNTMPAQSVLPSSWCGIVHPSLHSAESESNSYKGWGGVVPHGLATPPGRVWFTVECSAVLARGQLFPVV